MSHIPRSQMHSHSATSYMSPNVSMSTSRSSAFGQPYNPHSRTLVPASSFSSHAPIANAISIRNPWQNTFPIPVRMGRSSLEPFSDRGQWMSHDPIRLMDSSKPPHCAGLAWDLRIQSEHNGYFLFVVPLRGDSPLPYGYVIKYQVTVRVDSENVPANSRLAQTQTWETELDHLPEDFETGFNRIKAQRLLYEFDDFLHYHSCTYENIERVPCFRLSIQISVTYQKMHHIVTRHAGLIGAILTQFESGWEERELRVNQLEDEMTQLKAEHYRETRDLKNEMERIRDENTNLMSQISRLSLEHKKEYQLLSERHERNIRNLTHSIQTVTEDRQVQDRRLDDQSRLMSQQMSELQNFADKISGLSEEICNLRLSGPVEQPKTNPIYPYDHMASNIGAPVPTGPIQEPMTRNSSLTSLRDSGAEAMPPYKSPTRHSSAEFSFDQGLPTAIDISPYPSAPDESELPSAPKFKDLPSAPPQPFPVTDPFIRPAIQPQPPTPPRQPQRVPMEPIGGDDGYTLPPLVNLSEVETRSGHENETLIFARTAKVYRFDIDQWKERGDGKLQVYQNQHGEFRMVLRQDLTNKIRINQRIATNTKPARRKTDKQISWHGEDWSGIDDDQESTTTTFCARFKSKDVATDFLTVFNSISEHRPTARSNIPAEIQEIEATPTREEEEKKSEVDAAVRTSTVPDFKFSQTFPDKTEAFASDRPSAFSAFGKTFAFGQSEQTSGNGIAQHSTFSFPFTAPSSKSPEKGDQADAETSKPTWDFGHLTFGDKGDDERQEFSFGTSFTTGFGSGSVSTDAAAPAAPAAPPVLPDGNASSWNAVAPEHESGGEAEEEAVEITFKPLVTLSEIETKTGEEESETMFESRGKLYRWAAETAEWKERALGTVKVMKDPDGIFRILVRQEKTNKIRCHHPIPQSVVPSLMGGNPKTMTWSAMDFARGDEDEDPAIHKFCVRMKTEQEAEEFKREFLNGQQANSGHALAVEEVRALPPLEKPSPAEPSPAKSETGTTKRRPVVRGRRSKAKGPDAEATPSSRTDETPASAPQSDAKDPSEEVSGKEALRQKYFGSRKNESQTSFSTGSNSVFGFKPAEASKIEPKSIDFSGNVPKPDFGGATVQFGGVKYGSDGADAEGTKQDAPAFAAPSTSFSFGNGATGSAFGSSSADTVEKPFSFSFSSPTRPEKKEEATAPVEEDNGQEFNLKPVVQLQELEQIPTGHENEDMVHEYSIKKAYRFDSETQEWKIRAEKTRLQIWANRNTKQQRIVVRENETSKLRLNHFVPKDQRAERRASDEMIATWRAMDYSDPEELGENRLFSVRFMNAADCKSFVDAFNEAKAANDSVEPAAVQETTIAFATSMESTKAKDEAASPPKTTFSFGSSSAFTSSETAPASPSKPVGSGFSSFAKTPDKSSGVSGFASLASGGGSGWGNEASSSSRGGFGSFENFSFSSDGGSAFSSSGGFGGFGTSKSSPFGSFDTKSSPAHSASPTKVAPNTNVDDDNCVEYTLKPLVHLEETDVASGHEDENLLFSCEDTKLYRFTDTIDGGRGWKARGTGTLQVYQQKSDPTKTRVIMREHVTNKLRINAMVSAECNVVMKNGNPATRVWHAMDYSDVDEQDDDAQIYQFCARFKQPADAARFQEIFENAQKAAQ